MPSALNQSVAGRCLNCGAELHGAFCSQCGQRSVPADPSVSEIVGDAWQELSGYDGRVANTFRNLLHPGRLTIDYVEGRRARYLSPVRLYLTVSVIYFLIAAAVPAGAGGLNIGLTDSSGRTVAQLTPEDRAALLQNLDSAPWVLRPFLREITEDPVGFRARVFTILPRVFFGMLPVFAGIISLFYPRRNFPTVLVFAVHLHAFAFMIFTVSETAKLTRQPAVMLVTGLAVAAAFSVYALKAARAVFGGSWPATLAKAAAIAFIYLLASIPAFLIILFWATFT